MSKQLLKALPELMAAGVITEDTATRISTYYEQQNSSSGNRLFIVFGILGALLVGTGIILIIAHNWDTIPVSLKLILGFLPLVLAQAATAYILFRGIKNKGWREATGVLLFFAIATSISIVSQVYHIEGALEDFLFTWMCLALPVVYVLSSGTTAILYLVGITWYGFQAGYVTSLGLDAVPMYWVLLLLILPFYYFSFLGPPVKNNFYVLITWTLVISLSVCLPVLYSGGGRFFMIAELAMYSTFVTMGESNLFRTSRVMSNGFLVAGSVGVIVVMLIASFLDFWIPAYAAAESTAEPTAIIAIGITVAIAVIAAFLQIRSRGLNALNAKSFAFLFYIVVYIIGMQSPGLAILLINVGILALAIFTIRSGIQKDHLGILNYGLSIITALIICRFFDTDLSFILRGLLFIGVGIGFFYANYRIVKQRKGNT